MTTLRDVLRLLVIDDSRRDRWLIIGPNGWRLDTDHARTEDVVGYRVPDVKSLADIVATAPDCGVTWKELRTAFHDWLDEVEETLNKIEQGVLERAETLGLSELVPSDFMDEESDVEYRIP